MIGASRFKGDWYSKMGCGSSNHVYDYNEGKLEAAVAIFKRSGLDTEDDLKMYESYNGSIYETFGVTIDEILTRMNKPDDRRAIGIC